MKVLKKIIIVLLNIVLINLIVVFAVSLNLKSIIKDSIIKEAIKEKIYAQENQITSSKTTLNNDQINALLESPQAQELLDKYLNITLDSLMEEKNVDKIQIEEDVLKYLKTNKKEIEDNFGAELTDEMLGRAEEQLESKELSKIFKQNLNNTKNSMSKEAKAVLAIYKTLTSLKFKLLIGFFILLDTILIALLQASFYKLLGSLSYSSLFSGVGILLMSLIIKLVVTNLSSLKDFNLRTLTITGIVLIAIGIVLFITKRVLYKKISKGRSV